MTNPHRTTLILFAAAACLASLLGAMYVQHVMGILPCHLCFLQRYPPAIMLVLAVVALAWRSPLPAWLATGVAVYGTGLAIYHSGVERKWWAGPDDCTGGQDLTSMTGADLLNFEVASPIVNCDEISFQVLGLSLANYNILLSLLLALTWIGVARRS